VWVNGGYFVLRSGIFDVLGKDEDLVGDALPRLAAAGKLIAYPHKGFWAPMDTLKERAYLEELYRRGQCPWAVWRPQPSPEEPLSTAMRPQIVSHGLPA
jgi:glucose-1-phosphate cytidylyltransferase